MTSEAINIERTARKLEIKAICKDAVVVQLTHGTANVVVIADALPLKIAEDAAIGLRNRISFPKTNIINSSPRGFSNQLYLLLTAGQGTPLENREWNLQKKIRLQYGGRKSCGPSLPWLEQKSVECGMMDREYYGIHIAPVLKAVGAELATHRPIEYSLMREVVSEVRKMFTYSCKIKNRK